MFRHTLLLGCLSVAMFTSIALAVGRLVIHDVVYPGAFKVLICTNSILSSGQGIIFLAVFGLDKAGLLVAMGQKFVQKLGLPSFADATNHFVLKTDEKSEDFTREDTDVRMKSWSMDGSYLGDRSGLDPAKVAALVQMSLERGKRESSNMERSV